MVNTGKEYEAFVKNVYQAILRLKGVRNIDVKSSQPIAGSRKNEKGKLIEHEIDVHWEFEPEGKIYKTIIQAKDWMSRVKKGQMIEFAGIVQDIPLSNGTFIANRVPVWRHFLGVGKRYRSCRTPRTD